MSNLVCFLGQCLKSEFHFLPPICDFMTPVTPFNFLCHVLPRICNGVSIFTPFNPLPCYGQLGPTRGHLPMLNQQASSEAWFTFPFPSLNEPTKPYPTLKSKPSPHTLFCQHTYTPRPLRGRIEANNVSSHRRDQPCTILAVAEPMCNDVHRCRGSSGGHHGGQS